MPVFYATLDPSGIKRGTEEAKKAVSGLGKSFDGMGDRGVEASSRVEESMRRMAKIATSVIGSYAVFRGVGNFIDKGIEYNASMQDAAVGLAATIAATQDITDAQGKMLEGREKFNAAMLVSADIAKRIDAATKATTASELQLFQAVQATMGASSQQGATIQENIQFLSDLANAMSVLQLDLGRLDKEAFSLLTGNNLGVSAVAQRLNTMDISNETIQGWVEAGTVIENLKKSLEQYAIAGEEMAKTFSGAGRDLESTIAGVAEVVTKDLTKSLTQAKSTISETFYVFKDGTYVLRDEVAPLLEAVQDVLGWFGGKFASSAEGFSSAMDSVSYIFKEYQRQLEFLIVTYAGYKVASNNAVRNAFELSRALVSGKKEILSTAMVNLHLAETEHAANIARLQSAEAERHKAVAMAASNTNSLKSMDLMRNVTTAEREVRFARDRVAVSTRALRDAQDKATMSARTLAAAQTAVVRAGRALAAIAWPIAVGAGIAAIYELATAQTNSEKAAEKYADYLSTIGESADAAEQSLDRMRKRVKGLGEEAAKSALDENQKLLKGLFKELDGYTGKLDFGGSFRKYFLKRDLGEVGKTLEDLGTPEYTTYFQQLKEGTIAASTLKDRISAAKNAGKITAQEEQVIRKIIDSISAASDETAILNERIASFGETAVEAANKANEAFKNLNIADIDKTIGSLDDRIAQARRTALGKVVATELIKIGIDTKDIATDGTVAAEILEKYSAKFKEEGKTVQSVYDDIIEKAILLHKLTSKTSGGTSEFASGIKQIQSEIERLQEDKLSPIEKIEKQVEEFVRKNYPAQLIEQWEALQREALQREALNEKKFDEANKAIQDLSRQYASTFKDQESATKAITADMDQYRQAIVAAFTEGSAEAEKFLAMLDRLEGRMLEEASHDWEDGARRALRNYSDEATNAGKNMENAIGGSLSTLEDGMVNFATTGKLEISSMVDSIIADFARLAIRQSITGPLASGLGAAIGGLFTGGSSISTSMSNPYLDNLGVNTPSLGSFKFAKGGAFPSGTGLSAYTNAIVASPTLFAFARGGVPNMGLMGEAGAEAIMPLTRTSSGDLGVRAEGMGGGETHVEVYVNVENHTNTQVSAQRRVDNRGNVFIDMQIVDQIDNAMAQKVFNGNSQTARAMDRTRNLSPNSAAYRR